MMKVAILSSLTASLALMVPSVVSASAQEAPATETGPFGAAPSGTYTLDPTHAFLTFKVGHSAGLSRYMGVFTEYDATIELDANEPEASTVEVTIRPESLFVNYPKDYKASHPDTGFETWTEDLTMSDLWLNADEFPTISFVSTSIDVLDDVTGEITGDLTFLGVTKPVTLDVTFRGAQESRYTDGYNIGFDAKTTIKRSDFGNDSYIPIIGDEVKIEFSGEFGPAE